MTHENLAAAWGVAWALRSIRTGDRKDPDAIEECVLLDADTKHVFRLDCVLQKCCRNQVRTRGHRNPHFEVIVDGSLRYSECASAQGVDGK